MNFLSHISIRSLSYCLEEFVYWFFPRSQKIETGHDHTQQDKHRPNNL